MTDIVISLTTIPSRVEHIKPCIDSLRQQGLPIYVWLQESVERTGNVFTGGIPGFLQRAPVHTEIVKERGPITKLLPALGVGADTIITADDDVAYGEGWAKGLVDESRGSYPGCALSYRGRVFREDDPSYNRSRLVFAPNSPQQVDLITGTWGALYQSEFFDDSILNLWREWPWNDDLVINYHLREREIRRVVIPKHCDIVPLEGVYEINSLWQDVNRKRNDEGLEVLGW